MDASHREAGVKRRTEAAFPKRAGSPSRPPGHLGLTVLAGARTPARVWHARGVRLAGEGSRGGREPRTEEAPMDSERLNRLCAEVAAGDRHLTYELLRGESVFDADALVTAYVERLRRLEPEERLRVYRRPGGMSRWERWIWAARWPDEVPLVNDELEWVALGAADLD